MASCSFRTGGCTHLSFERRYTTAYIRVYPEKRDLDILEKIPLLINVQQPRKLLKTR